MSGNDSALVQALREHARLHRDDIMARHADSLAAALDAADRESNETTEAAVAEATQRARRHWDRITAAGVMTIQPGAGESHE
jgi:hypothetical protein